MSPPEPSRRGKYTISSSTDFASEHRLTPDQLAQLRIFCQDVHETAVTTWLQRHVMRPEVARRVPGAEQPRTPPERLNFWQRLSRKYQRVKVVLALAERMDE
jgi:hypothetical protein